MSMIDNIKEMQTKQKIMLVAIVVLVGFIIYFGYTTFFPPTGGGNVAPTIRPTTVSQTRTPVARQTVNATPTAPQQTTKADMQSASTQDDQPTTLQQANIPKTSVPTPEQLALLAESQQLQAEYIHLVNQYQVAQLQQKLAQTDAQIAAQKLAATKSYIETQKLTGSSGPIPTSSYGLTDQSKTVAPMQVMYVGQQAGVWTAMLGRSGNYYQVKIGTQLPDGSVVQSISSQGVILNKNGQNQYLVIPKTLDSTTTN